MTLEQLSEQLMESISRDLSPYVDSKGLRLDPKITNNFSITINIKAGSNSTFKKEVDNDDLEIVYIHYKYILNTILNYDKKIEMYKGFIDEFIEEYLEKVSE